MGFDKEVQEGQATDQGGGLEATVDACVAEANDEFMQDFDHHMRWLEKQKPQAAIEFAENLTSRLAKFLPVKAL
jgi:hypothetical protein